MVTILCLRLGFWQLTRAQEKKQIVASYEQFANRAPILWNGEKAKPEQYQKVKVIGEYLPIKILLDNQHYKHQFGYDVLLPYKLTSKQIILINQGWVKGDLNRKNLPLIKIPLGKLTLTGNSYYSYGKNLVLGPQVEKREENIFIVQQLNLPLISKFINKSLEPFILRLDKEQSSKYVREWPIVTIAPARHYAYACQWFGLGAVGFIGVTLLIIRKQLLSSSL